MEQGKENLEMTDFPARGAPGVPPAGGRLTGRHVLFIGLGFFAAVVAADATLITLAVATFSGIDTPDAYRKGLAYNERIAEAETQARLGWRSKLTFSREARRLEFSLEDAAAQPVTALEVTAELGRPATARADRTLVLTEARPGLYVSPALSLDPGSWIVTARARSKEAHAPLLHYETRSRLWLTP